MGGTALIGRLLGCAACVASVACSNGDNDDGATGTRGATLGGAVRCTYAFRQSNEVVPGQDPSATEFTEKVLSIGPNEGLTATLGKLDLSGRFSSSPYEGSSFSLGVAAGEMQILGSLYQFRDALPANQFAGGHGFTGLIYVTHPSEGGDYQLWCEAVP